MSLAEGPGCLPTSHSQPNVIIGQQDDCSERSADVSRIKGVADEHVYYVSDEGILVHNLYRAIIKGVKKSCPKSNRAMTTKAPSSVSRAKVVLSRPHRNKTPGHWEAILDVTEAMTNSGKYKTVYANKGLACEVPDIEFNRHPDAWGVHHHGKIDQVEVPSKSDTIEALIERMNDNRRMLGKRSGEIKIVPRKVK